MKDRAAFVAAALLLAALIPATTLAQPGTVEDVMVVGLNRMTREAFLHAFGVRPGDPDDREEAVRGYRRLWDLGLFEDLVLEREVGPQGGAVLIVKVVERPILSSVDYEQNKVLTRTQIEDRLKERKVSLDLGKPLSLKAVSAAEGVIRDYLGEKGFGSAEVTHEITEITRTSRAVRFRITPGGKTRIADIAFTGNTVFSERRIKQVLKLNRARQWYWPWSAKSIYHPIKWDQDASEIRNLYRNAGYLDVEVRPPVVEVAKEKVKGGREEGGEAPAEAAPEAAAPEAAAPEPAVPAPPPADETPRQAERRIRKEQQRLEKERKKEEKERQKSQPRVSRLVNLNVPIVEGRQYRTGEITLSGNTLLTEAQLRMLIPLRTGMVLDESALQRGVEAIDKVYADRGYLYAKAVRTIDRREGGEAVADVRIAVTEDKPYYVARIEFSGNTATQDRVLRRELLLREGELFSRTKLDISKMKVNQLGYFEVADEPVIEPVEGENRVVVRMQGEEKGRNEIQIGGGYSGYDGAFFTGYYSTRNFLGRGQILSLSLQIGGRTDRYSISFVEPYFLSRPYSLGFSLFRQDVDYGSSLTSSSRGGGVVLGRSLGRWGRVQANYNYQKVDSTGLSRLGVVATNVISSVTPSYQFNTVNNPYRPTRGWLAALEFQVAGGALGGDTSFLKPVATYSGYRKGFGKAIVGLHGELGMVREWGDGSSGSAANVFGVPTYSRFWIGGDTHGPRVFDVRSVTPLRFVRTNLSGQVVEAVKDPRGRPVIQFDRNLDGVVNRLDLVELGGDRYYLFQGEYVIPFGGPAELALFADVGNALFEDTSWGFEDVRVSAGVEMRFHLPVFPVPLRLIYGFPVRKLPEDRTSNFMFSIGRSF